MAVVKFILIVVLIGRLEVPDVRFRVAAAGFRGPTSPKCIFELADLIKDGVDRSRVSS